MKGLCTLAVAAVLAATPAANAETVLQFSVMSTDTTETGDIPAEVSFSFKQSQLTIELDNPSAYQLGELYFNADDAITDLTWASGHQPNPLSNGGPGNSGNGKGKGKGKGKKSTAPTTSSAYAIYPGGGMASYSFDWFIDFKQNRMPAGQTTTMVLDVTSDQPIGALNPERSYASDPGKPPLQGMLKFMSGPNGDSASGGGVVAPVPSAVWAGGSLLGAVGLLAGLRKRLRRD
ncbi:MAG: hypothetical protein ACLFV3_02630 [Phycisphaeraceae bacterium]